MKNQQITCENCHFFDASRHKKDPRTAHAGICIKWSQIELKSSTCKQAMPIQELIEKDIFKEPLIDVSKLPSISQLSFF